MIELNTIPSLKMGLSKIDRIEGRIEKSTSVTGDLTFLSQFFFKKKQVNRKIKRHSKFKQHY
jgi:hypothetical protein